MILASNRAVSRNQLRKSQPVKFEYQPPKVAQRAFPDSRTLAASTMRQLGIGNKIDLTA